MGGSPLLMQRVPPLESKCVVFAPVFRTKLHKNAILYSFSRFLNPFTTQIKKTA